MKKPQVATRTTDAVASFLYDLMRNYVPTGTIEEIVIDCERHNKGAAILHGPLGVYAVELAERLRQTSKEMYENDPIGTVGCPVGPPGTPGPTGVTPMGEDFVFGEEELASGVVWVAGEDGVLYTTKAGDPSHDTPEARARAILAQECEEAGLPLSRVIRLRKELDKCIQRWNSTTSFPKTAKDHEEFSLMNTALLSVGIEDYLSKPSRALASALHARSAPLLARIGKDSLLIQG